MSENIGNIYLIPTPIGNMGDITQRALEILNQVDIIACEDTRHSGGFLKKLGINKELVSYHDFNESARAEQLIKKIKEGNSIGIITDAGSPGISDPAYRIVRAAIENNINLIPLPGPCAIIPALTASGLPTDRFFFEGFLPQKSGARKNRLEKIKELEYTLVFYESPYRVMKTLDDILETLGNRDICIAREISKKFEEFLRGKVTEIIQTIGDKTPKGEFVIIIAGHK